MGFRVEGLGLQVRDLRCRVWVRWIPHPVIVAIWDNKDYIRVLFYSYYPTVTGWAVLPEFRVQCLPCFRAEAGLVGPLHQLERMLPWPNSGWPSNTLGFRV